MNQRPLDLQSNALPAELSRQYIIFDYMGLIPKDIETIGSFEHFMKAKEDLLNEIRNKSDLSNKTNNIVNCGMDDDDIEICDIVNEIEKKEAPKYQAKPVIIIHHHIHMITFLD